MLTHVVEFHGESLNRAPLRNAPKKHPPFAAGALAVILRLHQSRQESHSPPLARSRLQNALNIISASRYTTRREQGPVCPLFQRLAVVAIHADRNGADAAVLEFPRENRARRSAAGESDEGLFHRRFRGS